MKTEIKEKLLALVEDPNFFAKHFETQHPCITYNHVRSQFSIQGLIFELYVRLNPGKAFWAVTLPTKSKDYVMVFASIEDNKLSSRLPQAVLDWAEITQEQAYAPVIAGSGKDVEILKYIQKW